MAICSEVDIATLMCSSANYFQPPAAMISHMAHTFTNSFKYTFSLLGAVRHVFLLRPPASKSIPCKQFPSFSISKILSEDIC